MSIKILFENENFQKIWDKHKYLCDRCFLTIPRSGMHLIVEYVLPVASGIDKFCAVHPYKILEFYDIEKYAPILSSYKWVFLSRKDIVRQAISYYKTQNGGNPRMDNGVEIEYNFQRISRAMTDIKREHTTAEMFFRVYHIKPLRVFYEEICEDADKVASKVLDFFGIPKVATVDLADAHLKVMRNAQTEEWFERFSKELCQEE